MLSSMFVRSSIVGLVVGSLTAVTAAAGIVVSTPEPAEAAIAEPVTVTAKDYDPDYRNSPMPDLEVTFSQTSDLTTQGINISWKGAAYPSVPPGGLEGGRNFLQIFQCWGDDAANPGRPDRETCQYGGLLAESSAKYASRDGSVIESRVDPMDLKYTVPELGITEPAYTSIPFRSVDGVVLSSTQVGANGIPSYVDVPVNSNQFFTKFTTNEISWVGSGNDGTNSIPFEIQTVLEAPGLGCGTPRLTGAVVTSVQNCWLVVLPRGTSDNRESSIIRSGLFWDSWEHHLAVRLDFKPVGVRCQIGAAEKQLAGSELMTQAIASWQPKLCLEENGAAFVVNTGSDEDAAYKASLTTPNPLAMTSRAYETSALDPNVYAPIAVSGASIVFSIDRRASSADGVPVNAKDSDGIPFTEMNLTPRLLAKLLTNSYVFSLPGSADRTHVGFSNFDNPGKNSYALTKDPDFWQFNDVEWQYQNVISPSVADALIPTGRSDIAWAVWSYIMADAEARAFLNGDPDPWGMVVNPWYSTNPKVNPTGVGKVYPRDDFPKADPIEKPSTVESDPANGEGALNLVSFRPYTSDFERGAYYTLRSDGLIIAGWQKETVPPRWARASRDLIGSRKVIAVTTAASAAKFTTISASLRNSAGNFVSPTTETLSRAASAMTTSDNLSVLEFDHESAEAKSATNAYPLTMPVYAALNPLMSDAPLRATYAGFIRYAVQSGQVLGSDIGNLPQGYAPIPDTWVTQAMNAASAIQAGIKPKTPVNISSIPAAPYIPIAKELSLNEVVQGSGDIAVLTSESTVPDPNIGALSGVVPLSLLTGLASAFAVPIFTRARKRIAL